MVLVGEPAEVRSATRLLRRGRTLAKRQREVLALTVTHGGHGDRVTRALVVLDVAAQVAAADHLVTVHRDDDVAADGDLIATDRHDLAAAPHASLRRWPGRVNHHQALELRIDPKLLLRWR